MKIKKEDYMFSSMSFMERDECDLSNPYYEALAKIRDIQNRGEVPSDEDYKAVGRTQRSKGFDTVEYGYCTANIHYCLFESYPEYEKTNEYKDLINKRILYLLKNGSTEALLNRGLIPLNFQNYTNFLVSFYDKEDQYSIDSTFGVDFLEDFVSEYGNEDEKTIAKLIRKLCMKFKISEYM